MSGFLSSLSSYFTLSSLPPLPSLPGLPSLPQNIQRRFLSFMLKRSLGHLVREGDLDPDRLEAQVGSGTVEIKGAQLNEKSINDLIPSDLPLRLESGSLGTLSALIPWSTPFGSATTAPTPSSAQPLSLSLSHLHLNFVIQRPQTPTSSRPQPAASSSRPPVDLAESVASVADEFVRHELDAREERELIHSVHTLRRDEEMDPFLSPDTPDSAVDDEDEQWLPPGSIRPFLSPGRKGSTSAVSEQEGAKTLLAGVVEGLLARLKIDVKDVRVRVRFEDRSAGNKDVGALELELRIGRADYRDEAGSATTQSCSSTSSTPNLPAARSVKTLRVSSVAVHSRLVAQASASSRSTPTRRSSGASYSSSSSSEDEDDAATEMMMSQAVADLRESTVLGTEDEGSVYESATGGSFFGSGPPSDAGTELGQDWSTHSTRAKHEELDVAWQTLASFGSEEIVLRVASHPPPPPPERSQSSSTSSGSSTSVSHPSSLLPILSVDLHLPSLSVLVLPPLARSLYHFGNMLISSLPPSLPSSRHHSSPPPVASPPLHTSLHLKSLLCVLIYSEDPLPTSTEEQFWARPKGGLLPAGEIEVRVDRVEVVWSNVEALSPSSRDGRKSSSASRPSVSRASSSASYASTAPPAAPTSLVPTLSVTVKDMSILEHLAIVSLSSTAADTPPAPTTAPIMIFDSNLPLQYDFAGANTFPDFEHHDWRRPRRATSGPSDKSWHVRPGRSKAGGAFGGAGGVLKAPISSAGGATDGVLRLRKEGGAGGVVVDLLPVHFFFDLSLVERLLPYLRSLTPPSTATFATYASDLSDHDLTPPATPAPPLLQRNLSTVIDDLEAEDAAPPRHLVPDAPQPALSVRCPVVRAEIRCPASSSSRGIGDGSFIRSGIVILDVHDVNLTSGVARSGQSPTLAHQRVRLVNDRRRNERDLKGETPVARAEWGKLGLFLARVSDTRAKAFVVVGLVSAADLHDPLLDGPPLLPRIQLLPGIHPSISSRRAPSASARQHPSDTFQLSRPKPAASSSKTLECRIPSIRANIHKSTIEGLQYYADDITQWLDGAFGDGSKPKPRDDLKLIGSRFFGPKTGMSSSGGWSDAEKDEAGQEQAAGDVVLSLDIAEVDLLLYTPRTAAGQEDSTLRVMHLAASDIEVLGETVVDVKRETILSLSMGDASFEDVSDSAAVSKIFAKTLSKSLELSSKPVLSLRFISSSDLDGSGKETDVQLSLYNLTSFVTADIEWIADLAAFAKTPEGAFEDVVPSEVTRITLQIDDTSVNVAAPTHPGALVISLGHLAVSTELISDATGKSVEVSGTGIRTFLIDDLKAPLPEKGQSHRPSTGPEHWKQRGYASLAEIATVALALQTDPEEDPKTELDVSQLTLRVTACADSIVTFGALAGDLAKLASQSDHPPPAGSPRTTPTKGPSPESSNLLASLEEDTFRRLPSFISDADFIADDLPRNVDYLETHRQELDQPEPLAAFETVDLEGPAPRRGVVSEVDGETIRLLDSDGLQIVEDYWSTLISQRQREAEDSTLPTSLRVRVSNCDVSLLLHDGFDWHHTRKSIEDEVKSVRRRLEKIRQLLASGQTPDESIEQAGTTLFNSIYIGAPQFQADMDASGYLAALGDEDLLDFAGGDNTSQATSFQSVKGRADGSSPNPSSSSRSRSRRPKLTRSRHARVEVNLHGIAIELKSHPLGEELASQVGATVRDLEILDHIKTSTWKKFLTEMRSDSRGNVREAESDMVTIELKSVRPIADRPTEEGRLRAKILPLRLHVDQDALDFLKRFFSFKDGRTPTVPAHPTSTTNEIYLQHVEIFPVELKLDYKPKRVDYRALREGKTIELMNFFHFEGAEMTLRRITLSGITGWPRLFETLNDLWTPDVKANQLADIITGVSPIRSLVNVGSGVADLILLPIEQYKKDGRIVRGVQRGTTSFVKSTALEAIKLGARLATGTQVILEKAENVIGGRFGQPVTAEMVEAAGTGGGDRMDAGDGGSSEDEGEEISRYANQPADVKEGMQTAYKSLSRNINSAAETILAVPMEVYERSGTNGPVRAVVRAIPIAVLKPMIGASEAVSKTLFGLRNSLDPEARSEQRDKYK